MTEPPALPGRSVAPLLLCLWLASPSLFPQHVPRPPERAPPSAGDTTAENQMNEIWVRYEEQGDGRVFGNGRVFEGGIKPDRPQTLVWSPLSLEGYHGAEKAVQAFGRLRTADGQLGPTLHVAAYFAASGKFWAEISVGTESIREPMTGLAGRVLIAVGEQTLLDRQIQCLDQTGVAVRLGTPFPIVHEKLVAEAAARLPKMAVPSDVIRRLTQGADPDPVWYTHTTGSPRNLYWAPELIYWTSVQDPRLLERLSDFALAQFGFVGADDVFRPGRPYHLADDDGTPWQAETSYDVDGTGLQPARMFEGRPRIQEQDLDTLGRLKLFPKGYPKSPRNGYDQEHMEAERLYAAAILLRSERARRDLVHLAEGQWSEKPGIYHSSRTLGWCLRLYVRCYQVLRRPKDRARIDEILTRVRTMKNFGGRAKITCFLTRDYWKEGTPGHTWEATWQAATIATAAYEAMRTFSEEEDQELHAKAEEVFLHACECCFVGWRPGTKAMVDSYEVFLETEPGSGIPAKTQSDSRMGVAMWPIAAFALAYQHTRDERWAIPGRTLVQLGKESSAEGMPLNSLRARSLPYFVEANRIFKIAIQ